jgi:hypothetical protein
MGYRQLLITIIILSCLVNTITAANMVSINDINNVSTSSNEIKDLITYINQSGGIPLTLTTKVETNWMQFFISMFFGSIFLLWILGGGVISIVKDSFIRLYFRSLRRETGRPILFIKHTQSGLFDQSMIDQKTLTKVSKALTEFKGKDFDLILHTPGGEVFSALYIARIFRNYPGKIRTVIPLYAMSGGTILSLSTDEIYMLPNACLGPVDPQIGSLFKYGSVRSWEKVAKFKGKKAEDSTLSFAFMGGQYSKSIKTFLVDLIKFPMKASDKKDLVKFITSGDVEHAFPLTPVELKAFGIPINIIKEERYARKLIRFVARLGCEGVTYIK